MAGMSPEQPAEVRLPPHQPHCFGCGPANPASLDLALFALGDRIRGLVRFDRRQEGAPGLAHGGAVATLLDDALGSLLMVLGRPAVTARLCVDFRRPAILDRELTVEAWVDRVADRKLHLESHILDGDVVVAEAQALFLQVGLEHFEAGGEPVPAAWREAWPVLHPPGDERVPGRVRRGPGGLRLPAE